MKKRFFKNLSYVLILAMVVTVIAPYTKVYAAITVINTTKTDNSMTGVRQLSLTKAELNFASSMTEANILANLTVSSLVTSTHTKSKKSIKSVAMSKDGKTAIVNLYSGFISNVTYVFDYKDMSSVEFVGIKAEATDVVDLVISTSAITINNIDKDAEIKIQLLNKDGVDIGSINTSLHNRVTITSSSNYVLLDDKVIPNRATFQKAGDTTTITAIFHTYIYDNTTGIEVGTITKSKVITGVSSSAKPIKSITAWSLGTASFTGVNHSITMKDGSTNLYIKALKSDGISYVNNLSPTDTEGWKYESTDQNVIIVETDSNRTAILQPVSVGVAHIIVYYTENKNIDSPIYIAIGAIPISIGARRVATALNLSAYDISLSNTTEYVDSKEVTLEVLDQYGKPMPVTGVSVTELPNALKGSDPINTKAVSTLETTLTFKGVTKQNGTPTSKGKYKYAVTANGLTRNIDVTIVTPKEGTAYASYYKLSVDATSYEQKVTSTTSLPNNVRVKIIGYDTNGVAFNTMSAGNNYSIIVVKPDGTTTSLNTDAPSPYYGTYAIVSKTGSKVVKADTGLYTLRLYSNNVLIDVATFTITDTGPTPTYFVNKLVATTVTSVETAVEECFTIIDSNGIAVTDMSKIKIEASDFVGTDTSGSTVFIKNIRYEETIGTSVITHVIAVDTVIKLK